jgi:hypothetical protein
LGLIHVSLLNLSLKIIGWMRDLCGFSPGGWLLERSHD